jgi:chromatin segregation and condensation protein Rec8/ScpA/Scc1 (kleisin family)
VLERVPEEKPVRAMPRERVRLADRVRALRDRLEREGQTSFLHLLSDVPRTRLSIIVEFLAVLELIKVRYLVAVQSQTFGDIDLVRAPGASAAETPDLEADDLQGF